MSRAGRPLGRRGGGRLQPTQPLDGRLLHWMSKLVSISFLLPYHIWKLVLPTCACQSLTRMPFHAFRPRARSHGSPCSLPSGSILTILTCAFLPTGVPSKYHQKPTRGTPSSNW